MCDVTAILNVHNEEDYIDKTLLSLKEAVWYAKDNNIEVKVIVIADNPSDGMHQFLYEKKYEWLNFEIVNFRDPGLSRNYAAGISKSEFICFFDGDDLWSYNWISECFNFYKSQSKEIVCHPESSIYFGEKEHIFFHPDSTSNDFYPWQLIQNNYWTSQVFLKRETYLNTPQIKSNIENGFGYEDWQWNCNTLAKGIEHRPVPNTYHFIRGKNKGVFNFSKQNACLLPPTLLFNAGFITEKILK